MPTRPGETSTACHEAHRSDSGFAEANAERMATKKRSRSRFLEGTLFQKLVGKKFQNGGWSQLVGISEP